MVRVGVSLCLLFVACGPDSRLDVVGDDEGTSTTTSNLVYTGADAQFAGGFAPANAPFGGFGGASNCTATRTPIIYVPGNGDDARNFDFPSSTGVPSVYAAFKAAGYKDCELFGINWLSPTERQSPTLNYHSYEKAARIRDFITAVLAYTGASKVDIIGHSMGVTVALHALERFSLQSRLRRFIAISGALRGLSVCTQVGYANPLYPTCGSQNFYDSDVFGFYPAFNARMQDNGFRDTPSRFTGARFYSLRADVNDGFSCPTNAFTADCGLTGTFDARSNVISQLDVGYGSTSLQIDFDWTDYSPWVAGAGDIDGVGHFRAKNNTGAIQVKMLTTTCSGTGCCSSYGDTCG
ncbi:MAG: alpha/beta fold hydrolase [Myxococcota bacterium]